jgi:predicted nucleic acid-binding protein
MMFVDTSGWASLADRRQNFHNQASRLIHASLLAGEILVTTNLILVELTALLTSPLRIPKPQQIQWFQDLCSDAAIDIVSIDPIVEAGDLKLWRE